MKPPTTPDEPGQELVEFALTFTLLVLLVMGIFDLGRAAYAYSVLHNSVREGARYGIIHPDDLEGVRSIVVDRSVGLTLDPADVTVTLLDVYAEVPGDDVIQVDVNYAFTIVTPLIGAFFGSNQLAMVTQAKMRLEK